MTDTGQLEKTAQAIIHRLTNATGDPDEWLIPDDKMAMEDLAEEMAEAAIASTPLERYRKALEQARDYIDGGGDYIAIVDDIVTKALGREWP